MNTTENRAVKSYLRRLDTALHDLPAARRREIVAEIETHIAEELTQLPAEPTDAQVMDLLDRVGEPEAIAAESREASGSDRPKAGALETATLVLLLIGGLILPIIGWIVGAVLLWISNVWTTRDKLIGTLIVPGGLALPFALGFLSSGSVEVCVSKPVIGGNASSHVQQLAADCTYSEGMSGWSASRSSSCSLWPPSPPSSTWGKGCDPTFPAWRRPP